MTNNLISDESLKAYKERYELMQKNEDTEEGDKLFISKVIAVSEQIENLRVKAKIGKFEIESDGPEELGGSGTVPGPMPMLLATIANCLEITALLYLSFSNAKVNSLHLKVEGIHDKRSALNPQEEPFPGFLEIKYTWYVDTDESLKKIDHLLKKAEEICPVKGTFKINHNFPRKVQLTKDR